MNKTKRKKPQSEIIGLWEEGIDSVEFNQEIVDLTVKNNNLLVHLIDGTVVKMPS